MSTIQSVDRAFAVLRALASGPAGVSEVAERTSLPKSTVSRLLGTLVEIGAVEQSDVPRHVCARGTAHRSVGGCEPGPEPRPARSAASRGTRRGDRRGGRTRRARRPRGVLPRPGRRRPRGPGRATGPGRASDAHVVSSGLVLIANAPAAVRAEFLAAGPCIVDRSFGHRSLTASRDRLDEVRRAGFAWVYEEMSEGLNSVAAPIVNPAGTVIAAVHVHGPSYRFPAPGQSASMAAAVVAAARRISDRLAGDHPVGCPRRSNRRRCRTALARHRRLR